MFSQKDGITQTESETDDTYALLISCVKISCVKARAQAGLVLARGSGWPGSGQGLRLVWFWPSWGATSAMRSTHGR